MPAVRAAAAFAIACLTLVACGGGDDQARRLQPAPTTTAPEESTTTVPSAPAGGETTTTTRRATGAPTTIPAARPPAAAAAAPTAATGPPAAGTYRYDTSGSSSFGLGPVPFPAVTTLMVDSATGTRQRSVRDLRDPSGTGALSESVLDYRPDGVHLISLRLTTRVAGTTDVRELRPVEPVLILPTSARPGHHAEFDIPSNGGVPAHVAVDVLREETVSVGGQAVGALVIRAVTTLPPGPVSGRQELTVSYDRGSRLIVKERQVTDATAGLLNFHSEYDATLQRLTPGG